MVERLLIIEDDEGIKTQLKWGLSKDYRVTMAGDHQEALKIFQQEMPKVVVLDLGLPPLENETTEGMKCLKEILASSPKTKIIIVSGNDERENALLAIGHGAYDFYQKPVDLDVLKVILQRAFHLISLEQEYDELKLQLSKQNMFEGMVGSCPAMQNVFSSIKKIASTDATILINGESGTGKELVARAIHRRSLRGNGPFVPINCGAIPETLIESELFGYEKGAFTDARSQKVGLVEKASGGTLFLDEISELPLHLQVKLLRFLQERTIQRVGGPDEIDVDLRIIAATNIDLEKAVKDGSFRKDLFFRISVINITLPQLKERGDDIVILARSFLTRYSLENGRKLRGFSPDSIATLKSYHWPGNIRELENKIQRAVIMADGPVIGPQDLSLSNGDYGIIDTDALETLKEVRTRAELYAIQKALAFHNGNISKAAEALGVSRPTLHDLIKKYSLRPHAERSLN